MKLGKSTKLGACIIMSLGLILAGCGTAQKQEASPKTAETSAPAKVEKVKIMVSGLEKPIYLPAKLSEILGYYKEEGIDVELINAGAGQNAEESLLAGEIQGAIGFYERTIDLQPKGKNIESVVQFGNGPGYRLMVSEKLKDKVKSTKDLKGLKIGVNTLGSASNRLANYIVVKAGLTSADYVPVVVGSGNTLIASLEQGRVDAVVTTQPTIALLESKHLAYSLVDMETLDGIKASLGGAYPASSLFMENKYVKSHPDAVQRLANAYVKAMKYINTHSAEQIADLVPKEYLANDKDLYIQSLKATMPTFTKDGKMPQGGPEQVLDVLASFDNKLAKSDIKLNETFTNQFVDKAPAAK